MRKKLITMGLVSALGASTSALAIDLDASPADTAEVWASGSVLSTDLDADDNIILQGVSAVESTAIGVGVASGNRVFVRFDLTNGELVGNLISSSSTTTSTTMAGTMTTTTSTTTITGVFDTTGGSVGALIVAQGGTAGDSFVIYDITAGAGGIVQGTNVSWTPQVAVGGQSSVAMSVYETLAQAVNETESLYSISGVFATSGTGYSTTATVASVTAEVSTSFTAFATNAGGTTATGTLGTLLYALSTSAATPSDMTSAVADGDIFTAASSTVTLVGDVSFGDWYLDTAAGCGGAPGSLDLVEDEDGESATPAAAGIAALTAAHIVCVDVDGDEEILVGDYSLTLGLDTPALAVTPASDTVDAIGSIVRNGTVVQVPYLTTFADYNQRLVLVNRSSEDAEYTITFTSEGDTTATAGSAATGSIPAGEVLSLKATDIVSLTGRTRTAATVTVVAPATVIDVATNQVNLSDGSTDTVVLN